MKNMKDSLTLSLKDEAEITLPAGIAATSLSLSEIGAIVVMACLQFDQKDWDAMQSRMESEDMKAAGKSLLEKGIIKSVVAEKQITISVDLESLGL